MKTANDDTIHDSVKGSEGDSVTHQIMMSNFSCMTSYMQRHHSHRDLKEETVGSCFQNERERVIQDTLLL